MSIFKLLPLLLLTSCTLTPEEAEIREYRRQVDLANWERCEAVYEAVHEPTVHMYHSHQRHETPQVMASYIHQDLVTNNCKSILLRAGMWDRY